MIVDMAEGKFNDRFGEHLANSYILSRYTSAVFADRCFRDGKITVSLSFCVYILVRENRYIYETYKLRKTHLSGQFFSLKD